MPAQMLVFLFLCLSGVFLLPIASSACPKISPDEAVRQMTARATEIRHHNHLYYDKAQPEISDADYDLLFAGLVELEGCFPELAASDSPTRSVGNGVADQNRKLQHERPMLSLASTTGPEAVAVLLKRLVPFKDVQLLVQPKVDGVPVELTYIEGRLVSAATRGDGSFGSDVTDQVRGIEGVPLLLDRPFPERLVVRGEIYADLHLLKEYRSQSVQDKYAAPRHFAAGVLQSLKPVPAATKVLRLFPFELVTTAGDVRLSSDRDRLQLLASLGFPDVLQHTRSVTSMAESESVYRSWLAAREQQPFAMDGVVVKVDDLRLREQLGEGERAPFWAAAWKFPPDFAVTTVRKIHWTVGRTGRRTPLAEVEPVRLAGVLVSRVSLHNAAELARLHIGAGDQVVVALTGDVIPRIVEVAGRSASSSRQTPTQAISEAALDDCLEDSPFCREQFLAKTVYFASKSGLAIKGLGRKRLQKLIEAGLIVDLPSLFQLQAEEIAAVPGFSRKAARELTAAIVNARQADSFRFLAALGITGAGPKTVVRLSKQFTSLAELLAASPEQLALLDAVSQRGAKAVRDFFSTAGGGRLLSRFRELSIL